MVVLFKLVFCFCFFVLLAQLLEAVKLLPLRLWRGWVPVRQVWR